MSKLLESIKKTVKKDLAEAGDFKSDDGVSKVPGVEFDKKKPKEELKSKQPEGEKVDETPADSAAKTSKIRSTKKDEPTKTRGSLPHGKKPEVHGQNEEEDFDDELELEEDFDELDEDCDDDDDEDDDDDKVKVDVDVDDDDDEDEEEPKARRKVTKEDINLEEHMQALLGKDKTLTEEFKSKTKTIFEAAVLEASNAVLSEIVEELEEEKEAELEGFLEAIVDKVDLYLDKVVSEWLEENQVQIEHNVRGELAESFLTGLKNLFDNHYVHIDEDKVDVVEELVNRLEQVEASLDEEINRNVQLQEDIVNLRREQLVVESSEGLTDNQKERLRLLSEGLDYEDDDTFADKLEELKDAYFKQDVKVSSIEDDDDPLLLDEEVKPDNRDPEIKATAAAISKYLGKNR